jgi:hypothetical protein
MKNDSTEELSEATRASVIKEMEEPRMARSARIAELNLDTSELENVQVPPCPESSTK